MTNHLMRGHSSPAGRTVWMHLGESIEYFVPIARTQESFHWEGFYSRTQADISFFEAAPVTLTPHATARISTDFP